MNTPSPHDTGSEGTVGDRPPESSQTTGPRPVLADDELDLKWSTRGRCHAVLAELDAPAPDWDSIACLLRGGAEDVEASL